MPAHMASSVASMSARSSGRPASRPPTMSEIAASPCQPSTMAPQSIESRSPSCSTRRAGDAVDDLVVDRGAQAAREAVVAEERRVGAAAADVLLRELVERLGRHARADGLGHELQGLPDHQTGARRIRATWSGVLVSMRDRPNIRSAEPLRARRCVRRPRRPRPCRRPGRGAALGVELGERGGLLAVDRLPLADDLLRVVGAALDLGALEQPLDDGVLVDGQLEHRVEGVAVLGEHGVERPDLGEGARVAVEQESRRGVVLAETVPDDGVGDLVGDVAAGGEDVLDLEAELGLVLDVGAEDVAGGDGGDAEAGGDAGGLGALPGTRRTHDDQTHQRRNPS